MADRRAADIERGMELIPGLGEVMEDGADAETRAIYEDIRNSLRVPFVNFIYRILANEPAFFRPAWQRLGPLARTRAFEQDADALRARALLQPPPDNAGTREMLGADLDRLRAYTDSIHYVLPKLLLAASFFDAAAAGEPTPEPSANATDLRPLPSGIAEGTLRLPMVDPHTPDQRLRVLFDDIKGHHGHPGVATYYRALAGWPGFLEAVWREVRPRIGSRPFVERRAALIADAGTAMAALRGAAAGLLPRGPIPLEPDQRARLRAMLAVFRLRLIPDLLLVAALVKSMLDGPERAGRSPFSLVEPG